MKAFSIVSCILALSSALVSQEALAATVYVPMICATSGASGVDCNPSHPYAAYDSGDDLWVITVDQADTVYLYIYDWAQSGSTWSVSAETTYTGSGSVSWSKSSTLSTSPGETPEEIILVEVEANNGSTTRTGSKRVKIASPSSE